MFWRKRPYNRIEALAAGDRARARGRYRRAIKEYRKVLAVAPADPTVHQKLAPLLVQTGQPGEALSSFHLAAQGQLQAGFSDRALALYVQAAGFFPQEASLWQEIARLEQIRGRRIDAVKALVKGGRELGRRARLRPRAIGLLKEALRIEPWHVDATLGLARLLRQTGQRAAAISCLEDLASRVRGPTLRRVRWALVRLAPTPGHGWRWLRAVLGAR